MAITIATGTVVAIASTYGSSVNITAITNANPAVATLAAGHGTVVGDFLEITSGWERLNGRVVRVSAVATNDVTLESINTTSTTNFPTGGGTGTSRRITAWTNLSQISAIESSGGEQQFADVTAITDFLQKQVPTTRSPITTTFTVMSDPALGWYTTVNAADDARTPVGVRMVFPDGKRLAGNAYWSISRVPQVTSNEPLRDSITLTYSADPIRYNT